MISNIMQKLMPNVANTEEYKIENQSKKHLIELQKQGIDVQQYLDMYENGTHPNQIKENKRKQLYNLRFKDISELDLTLEEIPNLTDLTKLNSYLNIPITKDMEIIKNSLDGAGTYDSDFIDGQIALSSIVQAAPAFWEKEGEIGYAAFVFVYVNKGRYQNDINFLKLISRMLIDFRDEDTCPESVSNEMKKLYTDLNNSKSEFHVSVDQSLLDYYEITFEEKRVMKGGIIIATSYKIQDEKDLLPNSHFPSDGILPIICLSQKKKNKEDHHYFKFVKGEYYKAQ